jgi:hypothetical protein
METKESKILKNSKKSKLSKQFIGLALEQRKKPTLFPISHLCDYGLS